MRKAALLLALLAQPAMADLDCTITQQCAGSICETVRGGSLSLRKDGDVWVVFTRWGSADAVGWEGYETPASDDSAMVNIALQSPNGLTGHISVYPDGQDAFTVNVTDKTGDEAITATGNCKAEAE
jgi:hypothetical protein